MPKGKKYNAAEKHFLEKQRKYEAKIKHLETRMFEEYEEACRLRKLVDRLSMENEQLRKQVETLTTYTGMTQEDICAVCEKEKNLSELMKLLSMATRRPVGFV